jgi:hypothetical protein
VTATADVAAAVAVVAIEQRMSTIHVVAVVAVGQRTSAVCVVHARARARCTLTII